ncbi:nucleoside hydrolase [Rhodococcus fascians]|nr:nucleoside hydrolase [Rhodococcus fascians]MBY4418774.1 nucleoside hydrolase [Rhodococcus fascians]
MTDTFRGQVHVDTDCGVDDALALAVTARLGNLCSVTTTWGNCTALQAAANADYIIRQTGQPMVPIVPNSGVPPSSWEPSEVHGLDGLGDAVGLPPMPASATDYSAAQSIVEFARAAGKAGRLLAIAPLTNVAAAYRLDPEAILSLDQVVIMAGQGLAERSAWLDGSGDTNTGHDPAATAEIAASALPVTWVGIDVTRQVLLNPGSFGTSRLGLNLFSISEGYGRARASSYGYDKVGPGWRVPAHDTVAATVLLAPHSAAFAFAHPIVDTVAGSDVLRGQPASSDRESTHRFVIATPKLPTADDLVQKALDE